MKITPLKIGLAIAVILFLVYYCERKVENKVTQKEDAKVAVNEARIEANNELIECSKKLDSAYAAGRQYEAAIWADKQKKYDEELQKRKNRVRVAPNAPNADHVYELRELAANFETEEYQRAINNRRSK